MERIEKRTLDPDLTQEELEYVFGELDAKKEGAVSSQDIVRLQTKLRVRLDDNDLKKIRGQLGIGASMFSSTESVEENNAKMKSGASFKEFQEWVNSESELAKNVRTTARGGNVADKVEEARALCEEEARLRAFREADVWEQVPSKQRPKDFLGHRVRVKGYGAGTVIGYQKKAKLHYVDFEIAGTQRLNLSDQRHEVVISSDAFVQEFIDISLAEFKQQEHAARQAAETVAIAAAMLIPTAWKSGTNYDLTADTVCMELVGSAIDVGGQMGQVTGYRNGKHIIQFDPEDGEMEPKPITVDLTGENFRMLIDDFVFMRAQPEIQDGMDLWAEEQMAATGAEREDIIAKDAEIYGKNQEAYATLQDHQACADAVVASAHWVAIMLSSYAEFCRDFRPRCEEMDAEEINNAGGIDAVLKVGSNACCWLARGFSFPLHPGTSVCLCHLCFDCLHPCVGYVGEHASTG
jgi:hypothetical protein